MNMKSLCLSTLKCTVLFVVNTKCKVKIRSATVLDASRDSVNDFRVPEKALIPGCVSFVLLLFPYVISVR